MGGGAAPEQIRHAFLDAAEQLFTERGYGAVSMEAIARQAGFSRTAIYRHFPTRRELLTALVQRTTQRHIMVLTQRLPPDAGAVQMMVEALVIVASELVRDPLIRTVDSQSPEGTVASLIADDPALTQLVRAAIDGLMSEDANPFRPGVDPLDLAQFIIGIAMTLLLNVMPGTDDPDVARRYLETFVLPAILADPPQPTRVFPSSGSKVHDGKWSQ
ncbi:TetR/AcrR family transcriptional regulator [Mycolicibacterium sp. XJ662]